MNVAFILAVAVSVHVCVGHAQTSSDNHHSRLQNTTPYIKGKVTQVLPDGEKDNAKQQETTLLHSDRDEIKKDNSDSLVDCRVSRYYQRDTKARIIDMNKKYPARGNMKTLPRFEKTKEDTPDINTTSLLDKKCAFLCPQESLSPCTCDPCSRTINCSGVASFEHLFYIFHNTVFPDTRFETFLLQSPLMHRQRVAIRSDKFLSNTFGEVSFSSIRVESMMSLRVVEAGAFKGSEATLRSLVFKWNYYLTSFPFSEIENMHLLETLEVSGSSFASFPALPYTPKLYELFLQDNFIKSIPPMTFAELPSLEYLDLAFNNLQELSQHSLYFSSQEVIVFLDHNIIEHINEQTFSGHQPALLDVSYNSLVGLDQRVFQPILDNIIQQGYDSYVDAHCNPLQCSSISWLFDSMYLYFIALPDLPCF